MDSSDFTNEIRWWQNWFCGNKIFVELPVLLFTTVQYGTICTTWFRVTQPLRGRSAKESHDQSWVNFSHIMNTSNLCYLTGSEKGRRECSFLQFDVLIRPVVSSVRHTGSLALHEASCPSRKHRVQHCYLLFHKSDTSRRRNFFGLLPVSTNLY